ncbi:MAG: O-antigen ligase family protein [Candidatus Cloacimonetes bacterium]|nr:O-antigen ligase family protein [Candidatus Cloacimonadota bacterium]
MNVLKAVMPSHDQKIKILLPQLVQTLVILVGIFFCVWIGSLAEDVQLIHIVLLMVMSVCIAIYLLLFGISVHSSLLLLSLFFIKPFEIEFYFIIGFFLLLLAAELIRNRGQQLLVPFPMAMLLLLGFGILSASKITVPMGYNYFISTIIIPFVTLILFCNAKITAATMLRWMQYISLIGALVGLYGIVIAVMNPLMRLGSFWVTAMTINGFYTVAFFFSVTLVLYSQKRIWKFVYALAACLILFGMLFTYTRIVILAVAFGFFLLMLKLKTMRYVGIAFMLLMPLIIPSSMASRIEMGFTYDVSLIVRYVAWYYGIQQIIAHPFTGMGFSVWSTWYNKIVPLPFLYAQHAHNVYLNLMLEIGIVGAIAYFYTVWQIMRKFWKKHIAGTTDILSYGMWVAIMALLFSCLTDIFIQQYSISLLFWVSLGIMMSLSKGVKTA